MKTTLRSGVLDTFIVIDNEQIRNVHKCEYSWAEY